MKNNYLARCFFALIIMVQFLTSCVNDVDFANISKEIKIDQSLVFPVGEVNITVADILKRLESDMIAPEGNNINILMFDTVRYEINKVDLLQGFVPLKKVYKFNIEEIKQVLTDNGQPAASLITNFPVTVPGGLSFSIPALRDTLELGLSSDPNVEKIDSVKIPTLTMSLNVNVQNFMLYPKDLKFKLRLNNVFVKKGNTKIPLDTTVQLVNYNTPVYLQLSDVLIVPDAVTGNIPIDIDLKINSGSDGVDIFEDSKIDYEFKLTQLEFDVSYGKFTPQFNTNTVNSIPLDFGLDGLRL